jgi:uncharacterized membrane protein
LERSVAGAPVRREARWPAALAVLATVLLYITLPETLTVGPNWLFPVLALVLLVPLWLLAPHRLVDEPLWHRILAIALIALVNAANVASLVLLVITLVHGSKAEGRALILNAFQIWLTNVLVFALWYWELDRAGPSARCRVDQDEPDFLFPQMQLARSAVKPMDWYPTFVDYLYLACTNATAFSPTDTMPLTPWAKMLMAVQSLVSLLTVGFVAARAVNILS